MTVGAIRERLGWAPPLALLVCLFLVGCGNSSDGGPGELSRDAQRELLARVSAVIASETDRFKPIDDLVYADFAAARKELGLDADADVYVLTRDGVSPLASMTSRALLYAGRPRSTPASVAIDGRAISASVAVPVIGGPGVLVLQTTQPFEKIAAGLRRRGYVREGRLLVSNQPLENVVYPVVVEASPGLIVLAGSRRVARAALNGREAKLSRAAALINTVPGVARAASATRNGCLLARAAGQSLAPQEGEYVAIVDHPAEASRLKLAQRVLGDLTFGKAVAQGQRLRVGFRSDDPANAVFADMVDDDSLTSRAPRLRRPYACP